MPIRRDDIEGRPNSGQWLVAGLLVMLVILAFCTVPLLFVEPLLAKQALKAGGTMKVVAATYGNRHQVERGSLADRYLPEWLTRKPPAPGAACDTEKPSLLVWLDAGAEGDSGVSLALRPKLFDEHGCSFGDGWAHTSGSVGTIAYRFAYAPHAGQHLAMQVEGNPPVSLPSPVPAASESAPTPNVPTTGTGLLEITVSSILQRPWVDRNQTVARLDIREGGKVTKAWRPLWVRAENEYRDVRGTLFPTLFTDESFGFDAFCKDDAYLKLQLRLGVLRPDLREPDAEWRLPWRDVVEYRTGIRETQVFRSKDLLLRFSRSANAPGTGPQILWIGHGPASPQLTVSLRPVDSKPTQYDRVWVTSFSGSDSTCIMPERLELARRDLVLSVWRTQEVELLVKKSASL